MHMPMRLPSKMNNSTWSSERSQELRYKTAGPSISAQHLPDGRSDKWPTAVIESGFSQSISSLASVPRWWLTDSKGDVKIVLIILISQIRREISVEIAEPSKKGGGVTQRVVISQLTAQGQIRISGAPLVLHFGRVFLRPAGPNEGDIEFGTGDLERIASKVWRVYTQV
ncbi:LOW QUALITY PROTEIN: hypothetical protein IFM46972_07164 [Aspergillus udagawae]|uniref:Uncharacterized protein n=1 Tax=Aspergillus udagawae TaxID=91492 RepID=A0A8H3P802_9EURO|nr:LOW QUALITY PROTEIN: hypothetical protein IFM46972_07164 [Aspergillus udagawae]